MPNTREKLIELLSIGHECPDGRNPFLEESCSTCPYGKAENCGAEMQADHLIANGVTVQEWIPVTERLPEPFVSVLVQMPGEKPFPTVREGFISSDGIWQSAMFRREPGEVTHWQPMPQPPKGE